MSPLSVVVEVQTAYDYSDFPIYCLESASLLASDKYHAPVSILKNHKLNLPQEIPY